MSTRLRLGRRSSSSIVKIKGDRRKERHDKFSVLLANAAGTTIADAIGVGTIRND